MASQAAAPDRTSPRVVADIHARWRARGHGALRTGAGGTHAGGAALVYNISQGGCMIETVGPRLYVDDPLALLLPARAAIEGHVVWQDGAYVGMRFEIPLTQATVAELGFKEPAAASQETLARDRFGRPLPALCGLPLRSARSL